MWYVRCDHPSWWGYLSNWRFQNSWIFLSQQTTDVQSCVQWVNHFVNNHAILICFGCICKCLIAWWIRNSQKFTWVHETVIINISEESIVIHKQQHRNTKWILKGCSCTEPTFCLKMLIEKWRENNLVTHLLFIDYEKAFDSIQVLYLIYSAIHT